MKPQFTGYITPSEWRWVITLSVTLIFIAFLPYLWVTVTTLSGSYPSYQFMGGIHHPLNTAADLSKIMQTTDGSVLTQYLYTAESQNGTFLESMIYMVIGWIAGVTELDHIVFFHIARIGAALFMYMAIYTFAAAVWSKIRTRRIFFAVATLSSGLGWLIGPLLQDPTFIDINGSSLFPFQSTLFGITEPLVIGTLCLLTGALISALSPGSMENPSVTNSGLTVFLTSLLLALLYPQALIPVAMSFFTLILADALVRRNLLSRDLRWMLWFGVPALPIIAYYAIMFVYNPVTYFVWLQINNVPPVTVLNLLVTLGIPLVIALPGIYRAARHFEPDGNQLMFGWLISVVLLTLFAPFIRLNFAIGIMIPIAYFSARAMEDVWFQYVPRARRFRLFVALIPVLVLSNLFVLLAPLWVIQNNTDGQEVMFLPDDYIPAFEWLQQQTTDHSVVLASPAVSAWIPAWVGAHVVYGHPQQTLNPQQKRAAVEAWFATRETSDLCQRLLNGYYHVETRYRVEYVIVGPLETENGTSACLEGLVPAVRFEDVTIYRVQGEMPQ